MKKIVTIIAISLLTGCVAFAQSSINGLEITTPMPISADLEDHTGIKVHILQATAMDNGNVRIMFSTTLSDGTDCVPSKIYEKVVNIQGVEYDWTVAYQLLKQDFAAKGIQTINK